MTDEASFRMEPIGSWFHLTPQHVFRLVEIEKMPSLMLEKSVSSCLVAASRNGGPIALHAPGRTSSTWATVNQRHQNQVHLYTSLGYPNAHCASIVIDGLAEVLFLGWNETQDHLIVVLQNGEIHFFTQRGEPAAPTVYVDLIPGHIIHTANGVAGLCRSNGKWNLVLVSYVESSRGGSYDISMLDISHLTAHGAGAFLLVEGCSIFPAEDNGTTPLVNTDCTSLYLFYPSTETTSGVCYCSFHTNQPAPSPPPTLQDLNVSLDGVIRRVTVSPSGERLAYTTTTGDVYVTTTAFEELVLVHTSRQAGSPSFSIPRSALLSGSQYPFLFCGERALLVSSVDPDDEEEEDEVIRYLLVSIDGLEEAIDISDDMPERGVACVQEWDGVRMISDTALHFLQVVPPEAVRVFGVGSLAPGAVLRSAYEEFTGGNASAIHVVHQLQLNPQALMEGIEDCIRTAMFEWDIPQQQKLLRTAAFGKSFCSAYDPDLFVTVAKELRVRNTWRLAGPSKIAVSHEELRCFGAHRMMRRLVRGGQHHAAWVMCEALQCWTDEIRAEWALSKLVQDMKDEGKSEEEAARGLVQFFKNSAGGDASVAAVGGRAMMEIPFTELANVAKIHGKSRAAVVFLEAEEVAVRQVPMLLVFGEPEKALEKAIAASDGDLLFTVIQYLIRAGGGAREINLITSHHDARKLLYLYVFACPHYLYCLRDHLQSHPAVEQFIEIQKYLREQEGLRKAIMIERTNREREKKEKKKEEEADGIGNGNRSNRSNRAAAGVSPRSPSSRWGSALSLGPSSSSSSSISSWCTQFQRPKTDIARRLAAIALSSSGTSASGGLVSGGGGGGGGGTAPGPTTQTERYMTMQAGIVEKQTKWAVQFNDERFLTASVADMVRLLLEHGGTEATSLVAGLRAEYTIPEDQYQWCQAKAFAEKGQWDMVDLMGGLHPSKRLRPVLSGVTLVTLLLSYHRPQQAAKHIPRIPKIEERLEYYVHCGEWAAAGADCAKAGDASLLAQLKTRGRGSAMAQEQIQRGWDAAVGSSTGLSFGKLFS